MPERKTARWKIVVGYVAFALFALMVSLYLTFPYDAVKQRAQAEAERADLYLRIGSIGPGFFGVRATNVQVSRKATGADDKALPALTLAAVSVRPTIFPPGLSLSADAFKGSVRAAVGGLSDVSVRVSAEDLDLSDPSVKAFTGIDLAGKAAAEVELKVPRTTLPGAKVPEPDLGAASGRLSLELHGVTINGGTVNVAIPMYGPEPVPVDLPKIVLGEVEGKLKFDKGAGTVEALSIKGQGIEVKGSGTLKLAKRLEYSEPNIEVRFKFEEKFLDALGPYKAGIWALNADPKDPKWRVGRLTGYLGRPNFR